MTSGNEIDVQVQPQDVQAVMKGNALFAVQVENAAMRRTIEELAARVHELENGASDKEE